MIRLILSFILCLSLLSSCSKKSQNNAKSNSINVKLVVDNKLTGYLKRMIQLFNAKGISLPEGTQISFSLISEEPFVAANKIALGQLKVHGWLAASTSLVSYTNSKLQNLGPKQVGCNQLFASPIVVATREKHLERFTIVDDQISWKDIGFSANSTQDTSKRQLNFNHASPTSSITGLSSLIQLSYLAAGSPNVLTGAILQKPEVLKQLELNESRAAGYGDDDFVLLSQVLAAKNEKVHFTFTTEQQVALFNQRFLKDGKAAPIKALYPKEGTYWMDYNFCISDADWLTPAHKRALELFSTFLTEEESQSAIAAYGYRPSASAVPLSPPLSQEYGVNVSKGTNALLPVSAEVVDILMSRWPDILRPTSIVYVLDTSGSMEGPALRVGRTLFRNSMASTSWRDLKSLVTFSSDFHVVSDFVSDTGEIIPTLDTLHARGGSAVYDAINKSIQFALRQTDPRYRKTIIFLTDGGDKNSDISLKRLLDTVRETFSRNNINLIIVCIGHKEDFSDLKMISDAANGIFRQTSLDGAATVFAHINALM
ncbi:MAG: VWA domain-containing protein [Deltaproteobacteria bacterium]|nr:VWA domain-containing protein [Deltaproteobacteria bacterium]